MGSVSTLLPINASVIQGSAAGPACFLITASDLHPLHNENKLNKYADDLYLIIPASTSHTGQEEIEHITKWASANNLKLNQDKSSETIFTKSQSKQRESFKIPPPLPNIVRVNSLKILGVTIQNNFKFTDHVSNKLQDCTKSLYAIRTLKSHGLPISEQQHLFSTLTLSSLIYAAPAWWGFVGAEEKIRLDSFLN